MRIALPDLGPGLDRTMDATALNAVANHPDVRPWLGGGDAPIDLTALLEDPANLAGVSEHGGFLAVAQGPARYEVHSLFRPDRRAGETVRAMRAAVDYIFATTDATELVTKVPETNTPAAGLAQLAGFAKLFTMTVPWGRETTATMHFHRLTIDEWALRTPVARLLGTWFHDAVVAAKTAAGSTRPTHADDETHDRMAGATVLLVRGGQPQKAVDFYNRWAAFTGYVPIRLLRAHPIVIDIDDVVLEARLNEMEILTCQ